MRAGAGADGSQDPPSSASRSQAERSHDPGVGALCAAELACAVTDGAAFAGRAIRARSRGVRAQVPDVIYARAVRTCVAEARAGVAPCGCVGAEVWRDAESFGTELSWVETRVEPGP